MVMIAEIIKPIGHQVQPFGTKSADNGDASRKNTADKKHRHALCQVVLRMRNSHRTNGLGVHIAQKNHNDQWPKIVVDARKETEYRQHDGHTEC